MRKDILTIPNLLTCLRILLIPCFLYFYPHYLLFSMIILLLSAITDCLDGYIARKYHQVTNVGKFLDPLADKLYELVLAILLMKDYPLFKVILCLFLLENTMLLCFGYYIYKKKRIHLDGAHLSGKIATALFFSFSIIMLVFDLKETFLSIVMSGGLLIALLFATIYYFKCLWQLLMRDVYEN